MKFSKRIISALLVLVTVISCISITAAAQGDVKYGVAFTTGSNLRLRSKASTNSTILDTAPKGDVAVVISKSGDWYKVIYNMQEGYMHSDYLNVVTKENAELGYGVVNGTSVNLRKGPGTSYSSVAKATKGDKAYIIGINTGWYKVIYGENICYIRSDYMDLTEIPYENKASSKSPIFFRGGKSTGTPVSAAALNGGSTGSTTTSNSNNSSNTSTNTPTVAPSNSPLADQIVKLAEKQLGIPYKWGEESPSKGFDCSGLVYYVLKTLGVNISRTQATMYKQGTYVPKSELKPGDIVFFQNTYKAGISHVGIYVGNGKFIHAPQSGQVVSYADLNSNYYTSHYYGARRYG